MIDYLAQFAIRAVRGVLPPRLFGLARSKARVMMPSSLQQYLLKQERRTYDKIKQDDLHFLRDKLVERQDLMFQKLEQRIERLNQKVEQLERESK